MRISKANVKSDAGEDGSDFIDVDCFYNFVHSYRDAVESLDLALLYARSESPLAKKLRQISDLMDDIDIDV
jgi:hypothetical protein